MADQTVDDPASAAVTRPLRRDAERNRRRIIAAAREVFRDRGVEATLDDIAHHAGLGVGTVYRRFRNKEQLIEAMFADRLDEVAELGRLALTEPDPWDAFVSYLWRSSALFTEDRGLRQVSLHAGYGQDQVAMARDRLIGVAVQVVRRAQLAGRLRADFELTDLPVMFKMIGSIPEYIQQAGPDLWKRYLCLLVDGLRANGGPPTPLPVPALDIDTMRRATDTRCPSQQRP